MGRSPAAAEGLQEPPLVAHGAGVQGSPLHGVPDHLLQQAHTAGLQLTQDGPLLRVALLVGGGVVVVVHSQDLHQIVVRGIVHVEVDAVVVGHGVVHRDGVRGRVAWDRGRGDAA